MVEYTTAKPDTSRYISERQPDLVASQSEFAERICLLASMDDKYHD